MTTQQIENGCKVYFN